MKTPPYKHNLAHYAKLYRLGLRTVKRLMAHGKKQTPPNLPPLDEPDMMPAWWSETRYSPAPPDGVITALWNAMPKKAGKKQRPPMKLDATATDFPAQVATLRAMATDGMARLRTIMDRLPPPGLEPLALATWHVAKQRAEGVAWRPVKSTFEILRKAEMDLLRWQESHGLLVKRGDMATEIGTVIRAVHTAVKRLLVKARPRLDGLGEAGRETVWKNELADCFRSWRASKLLATEGA